MIRSAAIAAIMLAGVATPAAAADDGFKTFWKAFAAALGKDDRKTLAGMIKLGPELGDDGTSFDKFHNGDLDRGTRACLAKTKPEREVDGQGGVSYYAFCHHEIYIFDKSTGDWKLEGISADD